MSESERDEEAGRGKPTMRSRFKEKAGSASKHSPRFGSICLAND
jgi:hypothetical protein